MGAYGNTTEATMNTLWIRDMDVTGDVSVGANTTLNIQPGITLTFAQNNSLIIDGALNIYGTSSNPVTFTRPNGTTNLWNGIQVNGNATIDHAIIEHAQKGIQFYVGSNGTVSNSDIRDNTYGVYIKDTTAPLVSNCQVYDNTSYGFYVYNSNSSSNNLEIKNNTIHDNNYCGIHLSGSTPLITDNEIFNHTYGIIAVSNSSAYLGDYDTYGNNIVHNNNYGLAASVSNPFLGEETCTVHGGNNQFSSNTTNQIRALNNSYVQAELNWWGSNPPQSSKFYTSGGASIDYTPWLNSVPGGSMMALGSPETALFENAFNATEKVWAKKKSINYMEFFNPKWPLDRQLVFARDIMWLGDIVSSQTICKNIIDTFPESSLAFFALDILWQSSRKAVKAGAQDFESFKKYVHGLSVKKDKKDIYGYAELLSAGFETNKSVATASDNVYTKYKGSILPKIALYKKFMYYLNDLNDLSKAKETADQLEREFPNSLEANSASIHFQDENSTLQKSTTTEKQNIDIESVLPNKYGLSANYPNPFNPSTSVEFALPKQSKVDIIVYNSLGQFINKVTYGSLPAGYHTYKWEAKNINKTALPSGLYFLHFTAQSLTAGQEVYNKSVKMLLIR